MENKLYTWSKNRMKMIINTKFKEFNKQTNCISGGNVIANTEYGFYIRPYNETVNPVGEKVERGILQNFDLQYFTITKELKDFIQKQKDMVCLYEFFIYKNGRKDIIGHLVINNNKTIYKKIYNCYFLKYVQIEKRQDVLDYCEKILLEH